MKTTLSIFLLLFTLAATAQDYRFEVQTNEDSTFNLLIIEDLSEARAKIDLYSNMDTVALQTRLYSDINSTYERMARLERQIDEQQRLRSQLLQALISVDLNEYFTQTRVELDSFYIAPSWTYANSNGDREDLTPIFREANSTVMRDAENVAKAVIIPYSPNNIIYRFLPAGTNDVKMFSDDSRIYVGTDKEGVRHVLIKRR
jgi:hypothetical protein